MPPRLRASFLLATGRISRLPLLLLAPMSRLTARPRLGRLLFLLLAAAVLGLLVLPDLRAAAPPALLDLEEVLQALRGQRVLQAQQERGQQALRGQQG